MITAINEGTGELAMVFLKNGQQRMGILLNDMDNPGSFDDGVQLLAHDRVGNYLAAPDEQLIEVIAADSIDSIDIYLK